MSLWRRWAGRLPLLLRLAGLLWIAILVFLTKEDTFFVGDAGLKALQVQQFVEGRLSLSLDLGEPGFAQAPYREGFFPFEKPFVREIEGRFFSAFPVVFQAITAPFVAWFGFRGLYVWPLVGLWVTWAAVDRIAASCQLGPGYRSAVLALLIFCTPLSLYGALFWEHSLAVGLGTLGWATIVAGGSGSETSSASRRFAAGIVFSSAVWLREETLLLVGLIGLLSFSDLIAQGRRRGVALAGLLGLALPVMLWLSFNQLAYGAWSGLRAQQLDLGSALSWDMAQAAWSRAVALAILFVTHFPPVILIAGLVVKLRQNPHARSLRLPLLIGLVFFCLLPFGLPNEGGKQWGPRYLLPLLPLAVISLGAFVVDAFRRSPRVWGPAATVALVVLGLQGFRLNVVEGSQALLNNSRSREEPLRLVRADPRSVVVVSHQFTSQQLAGAFREKTFFLAPTGRGLKRLAGELAARGYGGFVYLCDPVYTCPLALDGLPQQTDLAVGFGSSAVTLRRLGNWGRYVAYSGEIVAGADARPPGH